MTHLTETLKNDVIDKETGLTEIETYFLDILFYDHAGDIPSAMTSAGFPRSVSPGTIARKLSKEIVQRSKEYLMAQSAKAAVTLTKVMVEPNIPGSAVAVKAAEAVLSRAGAKTEESVIDKAEQVIVILPPKDYSGDIPFLSKQPKVINHE